MVKNLVEKGSLSSPLIIWNRTVSKAEDFVKTLSNATVASSPEEAFSKADIIFICVAADKDVVELIATAMKGSARGKLFVDCSTIHPDKTNHISDILNAAGAEFVACPVFGAPDQANAGQLISVLAGPKAAVDKVKPYTKGVMSRLDVDYSDQRPGNATLLKIIGNTFILQMVEALAEGHTVAEKTGLGPENLHTFIEALFPGPYTNYSKRMLKGEYYERDYPAFHVDLARKDAGHALKLAGDAGARMKAVEVADAHLAEVQKAEPEKGDIAGIYGSVRMEAGLPFGNKK